MGDSTGRTRVILTDAELAGTDKVLLQLAHQGEAQDRASTMGDLNGQGELDDEKAMELTEWVYLHVEEVWSGFNLIAEAVAKGFAVKTRFKKDQARVDAWNTQVRVEDKVRMWVKNALVYGRCVMETGEGFLKVRDPRTLTLDQDDDGELVKVVQDTDDGEKEIPTERVHVFTLHRLFSDDLSGISAVQPVLQTIDDQVGVRKVNRAVQKRYRAPVRLIEMSADATDADRQAV